MTAGDGARPRQRRREGLANVELRPRLLVVLAAATLVELGFTHGVIGGYAAWREAGLITTPAPRHRQASSELAGMRPGQQTRDRGLTLSYAVSVCLP